MVELFKAASESGFTLVFAVAMLVTVLGLVKVISSFFQKVWDDREIRIAKLEESITVINNGQREAVMAAMLETRKVNSDIIVCLKSLDGTVSQLNTMIQTQPCHMQREEFVILLDSAMEKAMMKRTTT